MKNTFKRKSCIIWIASFVLTHSVYLFAQSPADSLRQAQADSMRTVELTEQDPLLAQLDTCLKNKKQDFLEQPLGQGFPFSLREVIVLMEGQEFFDLPYTDATKRLHGMLGFLTIQELADGKREMIQKIRSQLVQQNKFSDEQIWTALQDSVYGKAKPIAESAAEKIRDTAAPLIQDCNSKITSKKFFQKTPLTK
ncbi:MAG: hypothetical protein HY399_03255 [Elusimicrobia bacterium]|nr:hypothetical protein [Elusimicrobiota bacterium]